jgi:hypothetical protein
MPIVLLAVLAVVLYLFVKKGSSSSTVSGTGIQSVISPAAAQFTSNLEDIGQAIFQFEGNKNPGNLKSGIGMTGKAGGYATFADQGDGWDALYTWIQSHAAKNPDWDFYDMFDYYLRGSTTASSVDKEGNSDAYAEFVANYLGVDPTTSVASVLGYS